MKKRVVGVAFLFLLLSIGFISLVSANIFSDFFGFGDKEVLLSPDENYLDELGDFIPSVAYYHDFFGGHVTLWDKNGNVYDIVDGKVHDHIPANQKSSKMGLPNDLKIVTGYYHNFGAGGIVLWEASGKAYVYNANQGKFNVINAGGLKSIGIKEDFKPIVGYFDSSREEITIWDVNGNGYFVYKDNTVKEINSSVKVSIGLPSDFKPVFGNSFQGNVALWDKNGNVYLKDNGKSTFNKISNQELGFSNDFVPISGYYNPKEENSFLWGANGDVYAAKNGEQFELVSEKEDFKVEWAYLSASPSVVEVGDEFEVYLGFDYTKGFEDKFPESFQVNLVNAQGKTTTPMLINKGSLGNNCYKQTGGDICYGSYYGKFTANQEVIWTPEIELGELKSVFPSIDSRDILVVRDGFYEENLVLDEKYGDVKTYGYYSGEGNGEFGSTFAMNVGYSRENHREGVGGFIGVIFNFEDAESARKGFDKLMSEISLKVYDYAEVEGTKFIISDFYNEGFISIWRSENKVIAVLEVDNERIEKAKTNDKGLSNEDFVKALIGKGNSQGKEISVDDFDELYLSLIKDYLLKHSSSLTGEEISCIPSIECSLTPLVCPSHGTQVEKCFDRNGCVDDYQREISCTPGVCFGCSVEGGDSCVPYGFRTSKFDYSSNQENNFYCDLSGRTLPQKGNDGECNNDYECFSNECRAGFCVDTYTEVVAQGGLLKRIWCTLTNLPAFGGTEEGYQQCLIE